jgi:uncharacterized membrane protein YhaH (DUF805 family)
MLNAQWWMVGSNNYYGRPPYWLAAIQYCIMIPIIAIATRK